MKDMYWFLIMMWFAFVALITIKLMPPDDWTVSFVTILILGAVVCFYKFVKETLE